jgi:hypothetical protein
MNYLWVDWLVLRIALVWKAIRNWRDLRMLRQLFRSASSDGDRARAPAFDADTDDGAVRAVAAAIDLVLEKAEAERAGLTQVLNDMLSPAEVVTAFDDDQVPIPTEDRAKMLTDSDAEMGREQERLRVVQQNISHFKFLKAALRTRFPDTKI